MTGLRSILGLVFLMTTALVFGEIDSPSPALARAAAYQFPVTWFSGLQISRIVSMESLVLGRFRNPKI